VARGLAPECLLRIGFPDCSYHDRCATTLPAGSGGAAAHYASVTSITPCGHKRPITRWPPSCSAVSSGVVPEAGVSPSPAADRGRPPQAAARRAGLEGEEELLTATLTSTDRTERDAGKSVPVQGNSRRPAPPGRPMLVSWPLLADAPRRPSRRRPPAARPQLIGQDLDHRGGRSVRPSMPAVSGQPAPVAAVDTAPSARSGRGRPHGRIVAAWQRRCDRADGPLACADSQQPPARSCCPPGLAKRAPQCPTRYPHGARRVHLDRGAGSTRTGSGVCWPSAARV